MSWSREVKEMVEIVEYKLKTLGIKNPDPKIVKAIAVEVIEIHRLSKSRSYMPFLNWISMYYASTQIGYRGKMYEAS